MAIWKFNTRHFSVQLHVEEDVLSTAGMDRSMAAECRDKVASGEWQCFMAEIQVVHRATGTIVGESYLGGNIYANPSDFRDHFGMRTRGYGSYFSQMVREALADARKRFGAIQQSVSEVKLRSEVKVAA